MSEDMLFGESNAAEFRRLAKLATELAEQIENGPRHVVRYTCVNESPGMTEVIRERAKQMLRFSPEHDDDHVDGQLVFVAYRLLEVVTTGHSDHDDWGIAQRHSGDEEALLRIAAALIVAELDRRYRCGQEKTAAAGEQAEEDQGPVHD